MYVEIPDLTPPALHSFSRCFAPCHEIFLQGLPTHTRTHTPPCPLVLRKFFQTCVFLETFSFHSSQFWNSNNVSTCIRYEVDIFLLCLRSLGILLLYIHFFFVTFSQQSSLICIHRKACAKSAHQTKHRHSRTQKKEQESRAFLCTQKKITKNIPRFLFAASYHRRSG